MLRQSIRSDAEFGKTVPLESHRHIKFVTTEIELRVDGTVRSVVAYDDQVYVDDRTIDSHIKRLRKRFRSTDAAFDMIETLYGVGYRFKEL